MGTSLAMLGRSYGERQGIKAALLAQVLQQQGMTAEHVLNLSREGWLLACEAAQVGDRDHKRQPSDETKRLVLNLLAHWPEERSLRCPTCGMGNPGGDVGPALPAGHGGECRR